MKYQFSFSTSRQNIIAAVVLAVTLFLITQDFIFGKLLKFRIPAVSTLTLTAGLCAIALASGLREGLKLVVPKQYFLVFALASIFSLVNSLALGFEVERFVPGWYYTYLFALFFLVFFNVPLARADVNRLLLWLCVSILILEFIDLIVFRNNSSIFGYFTIRSAWHAMGVVTALYLFKEHKKKRFLILMGLSFMAIIGLPYRKGLVGAGLAMAIFAFMDGSPKQKLQRLVLILSPAAIYLMFAGDYILRRFTWLHVYFDPGASEKVARTALSATSFVIAKDYFPWGSGLGTYASKPAAALYSQLYTDYGLSTIRGLEPWAGKNNTGSFLLDTWWPHLVAELGFLGLILYLFLFIFPIRMAHSIHGNSPSRKNTLFVIYGWTLVILLQGMGSTYPEQIQFIILYSGITAILLRNELRGPVV